jgi:hypothetical protein
VQLKYSMKKQTFAIIFLVLVAACTVGFWLITKNNTISCNVYSSAPGGTIRRMFGDPKALEMWLPKDVKKINYRTYSLDDCDFSFMDIGNDQNNLCVKYKNIETNSLLFILEQKVGNNISINFQTLDSSNFLGKYELYKNKKHIENTTNKLLNSFILFLGDNKNIYGLNFDKVILKDSTLISLKASSINYPTTAQIYETIDVLRKYAIKNNAAETNAPMLNIYKNEMGTFNYMVALPINKSLENEGDIIAKRMLAGGNIIESDTFVGGRFFIDKCLLEIENYKNDHNLISPAIPYESLITDRRTEADTMKWKTKLFFPIF